jgi:hypothetical protein
MVAPLVSPTGGGVDTKRSLPVVIQTRALPSLEEARASLVATSRDQQPRALSSTVPPLLEDTFRILTEIAVERAKEGAFETISQEVTFGLCELLQLPEDPSGTRYDFGALNVLEGERLLPRTCDAARALRLPDLANAGPAFTRALEGDAVDRVLTILADQIPRALTLNANPPKELSAVAKAVEAALAEQARLRGDSPPGEPVTAFVDALTALPNGALTSLDALRSLAAAVKKGTEAPALDCNTHPQWCEGTSPSVLRKEIGTAYENAASAIRNAWLSREFGGADARPHQLRALAEAVDGSLTFLIACEDATTVGNSNESDLARLRALRRLRTLTSTAGNPALAELIERVKPVIVEIASDPAQIDVGDAQLLVLTLGQAGWGEVWPSAETCAIDLGFAVAGACREDGACDAAEVADMVEHPEDWFALEGACEPELASVSLLTKVPELPALIESILRVLSATKSGDSRTQIRASLDVAFSLADLMVGDSMGGAAEEALVRDLLRRLRLVSLAIVDQEVATVLVETNGLLVSAVDLAIDTLSGSPKHDQNAIQALAAVRYVLSRAMPVVTTLVSNSELLTQAAGDEKQVEALRAARKEALEALIKASTQRTNRGGDLVVSLGSPVGFAVGGSSVDATWVLEPRLRVPASLALQWLPRPLDRQVRADRWRCMVFEGKGGKDCREMYPATDGRYGGHRRWGGIINFTPLELGSLLHTTTTGDPIYWQDLIVVELSGGVAPPLGSPQHLLSLNGIVQYRPFGPYAGSWFLGGGLSYFVPFFDFN